MRGLHERMVVALERIAEALEAWEAAPQLDEPACAHPLKDRRDYSTMGRERWECVACGARVGMEDIGGRT